MSVTNFYDYTLLELFFGNALGIFVAVIALLAGWFLPTALIQYPVIFGYLAYRSIKNREKRYYDAS